MVRKKKEPNRIDDMLDDLLADCQGPEDILGESGLLKPLSVRLVERALAGELSHHLAHDETSPEADSLTSIILTCSSQITEASYALNRRKLPSPKNPSCCMYHVKFRVEIMR